MSQNRVQLVTTKAPKILCGLLEASSGLSCLSQCETSSFVIGTAHFITPFGEKEREKNSHMLLLTMILKHTS